MTIAGPAEARPANGLAVEFVVESDRANRLRSLAGAGRSNADEHRTALTLDDAVADLNRTERRKGKTIIRGRP